MTSSLPGNVLKLSSVCLGVSFAPEYWLKLPIVNCPVGTSDKPGINSNRLIETIEIFAGPIAGKQPFGPQSGKLQQLTNRWPTNICTTPRQRQSHQSGTEFTAAGVGRASSLQRPSSAGIRRVFRSSISDICWHSLLQLMHLVNLLLGFVEAEGYVQKICISGLALRAALGRSLAAQTS